MRLIALFVSSLFLAIPAAHAVCPIEDRPIVVGAPMVEPFVKVKPFVMADGIGTTVGFDVDLLESALDRVGSSKVTYVPLELS